MSVWNKYKVKNLPTEEQAEVIKTIAVQEEETKRARINNSDYRSSRIWMVAL